MKTIVIIKNSSKQIQFKGRSVLAAVLSSLAVLGLAGNASAQILYSTPVTISDSNVSTDGALLYAVDFAQGLDEGTSIAVDGVTFTSAVVNGNQISSPNFTTTFPNSNPGGNGSSSPFTDLSANLQTLLSVSAFDQLKPAPNGETITLENLTSGDSYQVQFFVNSSGLGGTETFSGLNSQAVAFSSTNDSGGIGQEVIGSFIASGTTQLVTIEDSTDFQSRYLVDAFQVRDVTAIPEPSNPALLLVGFSALAARWLRRKSANI